MTWDCGRVAAGASRKYARRGDITFPCGYFACFSPSLTCAITHHFVASTSPWCSSAKSPRATPAGETGPPGLALRIRVHYPTLRSGYFAMDPLRTKHPVLARVVGEDDEKIIGIQRDACGFWRVKGHTKVLCTSRRNAPIRHPRQISSRASAQAIRSINVLVTEAVEIERRRFT